MQRPLALNSLSCWSFSVSSLAASQLGRERAAAALPFGTYIGYSRMRFFNPIVTSSVVIGHSSVLHPVDHDIEVV